VADDVEAGVNVPKRPNVLWIGDEIADGLRSAVEALGLTVILTNVEGAEPERQNPHAVVMPFDGVTEEKFRGRLAHLLIRSLDSGALVTVLAQPHTDYEVASKLAMERVQVEDAHATDLRDVYPNFHVIHPDVRELARLLRDHNPGLAADQHLVLQDHEGSTTPAEKLLLRRAFSGFDRIVLKPLSGGRSPDSKVWRVEAHAGERCCEPFVAKSRAASYIGRRAEHVARTRVELYSISFPRATRSGTFCDGSNQGATSLDACKSSTSF